MKKTYKVWLLVQGMNETEDRGDVGDPVELARFETLGEARVFHLGRN